jgi:hypothetical protein
MTSISPTQEWLWKENKTNGRGGMHILASISGKHVPLQPWTRAATMALNHSATWAVFTLLLSWIKLQNKERQKETHDKDIHSNSNALRNTSPIRQSHFLLFGHFYAAVWMLLLPRCNGCDVCDEDTTRQRYCDVDTSFNANYVNMHTTTPSGFTTLRETTQAFLSFFNYFHCSFKH